MREIRNEFYEFWGQDISEQYEIYVCDSCGEEIAEKVYEADGEHFCRDCYKQFLIKNLTLEEKTAFLCVENDDLDEDIDSLIQDCSLCELIDYFG